MMEKISGWWKKLTPNARAEYLPPKTKGKGKKKPGKPAGKKTGGKKKGFWG